MSNMNDWNDLMQRRGAIAALEALLADVCWDEIIIGDSSLEEIINRHIEKYRK